MTDENNKMNKGNDQHGNSQGDNQGHSGTVATEQEKAPEADRKDVQQSKDSEEKRS